MIIRHLQEIAVAFLNWGSTNNEWRVASAWVEALAIELIWNKSFLWFCVNGKINK